MLTIIFYAAVIWVTFKLLILGIKATLGIAKVFLMVLLFPLFVIGLFLIGLTYVAIGILIITGIATLMGKVAFD